MFVDPILREADMITSLIAGGRSTGRVSTGVYEIGHFSFDTLISKRGGNLYEEDDWIGTGYDFATNTEVSLPAGLPFYGVCDSIQQFLADFGKALEEDSNQYCVSFTPVEKVPGEGGWRWHKWGPYLGKGKPECEYLADEEGFQDGVYVYHIFQRKSGANQ